MRFVNLAGRAAVLVKELAADLEQASGGKFGPDPQAALEAWPELQQWYDSVDWNVPPDPLVKVDRARLGPFAPRPRQVFAIGLNYRGHAAESNLPIPEYPVVFTKFASCLVGPEADVRLSGTSVDWEAELVVALAKSASQVSVHDAWSYVAGLSVGQDISDRVVQMRPPVPQFALAKSFPTFGPIGPVLVSVDEFAKRDDLEIVCRLDDEVVQQSRTSDLIFSVSDLIAFLSSIVTLYAGDLIFTGTPAGVGAGRNPRRFLKAGEVLETEIEGIGVLRNQIVGGTAG